MAIAEVASMANLATGAEVATGATTIAEVAKAGLEGVNQAAGLGLANTLEKAAAVNPHQAIANLAGAPNLITDAKGTEVFIPPVVKPSETPNTPSPVGPAIGLEGKGVAKPVAAAAEVNAPGVPKPQAETIAPQSPTAKVEATQPGETQINPETAKQQPSDEKKPEAKATTSQQPTEQGKPKTETTAKAQETKEADAKIKPPEERQQRIEELQKKIEKGTATRDELIEYRNLKGLQTLTDKILSGEFTDDDLGKWEELVAGKENPQEPKETEVEQIRREIEELGIKILRNEGDRVENIVRFQQLWNRANGLKPQMSEERARQLVNSVLNPDKSTLLKTAKEIAIHREIKAKLERLMALELKILVIPQQLEALKKQAEEIKGKIDEIEREIHGVDIFNNEQMFKKRMDRYSFYMQLANVKAAILQTRLAAPILIAEYKDTMQYVRRKLGVTHGFPALLEWLDAKLNKTAIDLYVEGMSYSTEE